jgi:hypothetical protein
VGNFWNIMYQYGVDLVLDGSAHDYERFAPQDPLGRLDNSYGIREIVVGTGGDFTYNEGTPQPNSQVYDSDSYGVLKLTLHSNSYDWQFLPVADGQTPDGGSFTDSGTTTCHPAPPAPAPNTPKVRSQSSNTTNGASSLTINTPSGTSQGDLLLATISHQGGTSTNVTPPAGWTLVPGSDFSDGTNARIDAYYHFAGASEPSSYTFSLTNGASQTIAGGILDITGASQTSPFNAVGGHVNASSRWVTASSITTTVPNTLLVFAGAANVNASWSPPGLMSEEWQGTTNGAYNISDETSIQALAASGATGARPALLSTTGRSVAELLAIAPAS